MQSSAGYSTKLEGQVCELQEVRPSERERQDIVPLGACEVDVGAMLLESKTVWSVAEYSLEGFPWCQVLRHRRPSIAETVVSAANKAHDACRTIHGCGDANASRGEYRQRGPRCLPHDPAVHRCGDATASHVARRVSLPSMDPPHSARQN